MNRRRFLRVATAAGASAVGVGVYTWQIEPHWLEVVSRPLPISNLPNALTGRRLVQLSDLHAGRRVSDAYLLTTFERVTAMRPEIVVYTGDFVSYHPDIYAQLSRLVGHLPRGGVATLAILGNHDYGPGWAHPEIAAELEKILTAAGIRVLVNRSADVEGLRVVGMGDLWANQFDPGRALADVDPRGATLALSHNPDTLDVPGWETFSGWVLSGHTHGGQCKPPFLPPPLLPVRNKRYTSGEFVIDDKRRLYISRGVGHLTQVRFGVRPEVTVFELVRA